MIIPLLCYGYLLSTLFCKDLSLWWSCFLTDWYDPSSYGVSEPKCYSNNEAVWPRWPTACYIIHIYTFTRDLHPPWCSGRFTPATCHGTFPGISAVCVPVDASASNTYTIWLLHHSIGLSFNHMYSLGKLLTSVMYLLSYAIWSLIRELM